MPRARRALDIIPGDLRSTHFADRKGRDLAVAVDPHGRLHYGRDDAGGDHIVAILGEKVSDEYLAELRDDGVSYLFAGKDGHDLYRAMETLAESFGVETLLLEGGGTINSAFLKAGLIDEISVLIYPGIDGLAGVPSIFEYSGEDGRSRRLANPFGTSPPKTWKAACCGCTIGWNQAPRPSRRMNVSARHDCVRDDAC
jgi:5-amino-6-(5-phosphoribosylamino)uracil reductase